MSSEQLLIYTSRSIYSENFRTFCPSVRQKLRKGGGVPLSKISFIEEIPFSFLLRYLKIIHSRTLRSNETKPSRSIHFYFCHTEVEILQKLRVDAQRSMDGWMDYLLSFACLTILYLHQENEKEKKPSHDRRADRTHYSANMHVFALSFA